MISNIKYLILDVDGTLTDGGIYYDNNGNELKKFNTKDAAGIFVLRSLGVKIVVITGRESNATKKRMEELHIDYIFQNVKDKYSFLKEFIENNCIAKEELGYIGDDLNDLSSMSLVSFIACPKDACKEVKNIASYISDVKGGQGAVRDIIENNIDEKLWKEVTKKVYNIGI